MPDSTGFGDYTESGQVIPVSFNGRKGGYMHCMYLNDDPPIAGGRELWGFPKKLATEPARREGHAGRHARLRLGARGYRHDGLQAPHVDLAAIKARCGAEFPAQDHSARRWHAAHMRAGRLPPRGRRGQGRLDRACRAGAYAHALAPVAELPVLEVVSAVHIVADLTLGLGKVVHDYLR